jgi:hypothetical protein
MIIDADAHVVETEQPGTFSMHPRKSFARSSSAPPTIRHAVLVAKAKPSAFVRRRSPNKS